MVISKLLDLLKLKNITQQEHIKGASFRKFPLVKWLLQTSFWNGKKISEEMYGQIKSVKTLNELETFLTEKRDNKFDQFNDNCIHQRYYRV